MSDSWTPQFNPQEVSIVKEQLSYPGHCQVKTFQIKIPFFEGGYSETITRDVVIRPPAVAVLLYDPKSDLVMLIEQFRTGVWALGDSEQSSTYINPWLLETVAGTVEPNHSLLETAFREVMEETGSTVTSLTPICTYMVSPGISSEITHIYYGQLQCVLEQPVESRVKYAGLKEEGEDIKVHLLPAELVFQLLKEGKIVSAATVISIQWLALNRDTLRSKL